MTSAYPAGTVAVNWDERYYLIRSPFSDYWLDSRYQNLGRILRHDSGVTEPEFTIVRPLDR